MGGHTKRIDLIMSCDEADQLCFDSRGQYLVLIRSSYSSISSFSFVNFSIIVKGDS